LLEFLILAPTLILRAVLADPPAKVIAVVCAGSAGTACGGIETYDYGFWATDRPSAITARHACRPKRSREADKTSGISGLAPTAPEVT
jgi:hypothetical protein